MADKPYVVRYELHTDLECTSGTYLTTFLNLGTRMKRVNGEGELKLEVEPEEPAAALLAEGQVIRVVFSDGSVQEWRISDIVDAVGSTEKTQITAQRDTTELSERELLVSKVTNNVESLSFSEGPKSPTKHIQDHILPALPAFWSLGTVDVTTPVVVAYDFDSPRSGLQKIMDAVVAAGSTAELDVRKRPGTTGYYLDLYVQLGSSQPVADIRTGKNLEWLRRTRTRKRFATRIVPKGDSSALISDAYWLIPAGGVSGSNVTLQVPESTGGPIGEDGQLNGMYLEKPDGTLTQITGSVASTQVVTVASAAGLAAKQLVRIRANSSGQNVISLARTSTKPKKLKGLPISGYGARTNFALNPVFERWTAGLPDEWTEVDPGTVLTISEDATRAAFGSRSAKLSVSPGNGSPAGLKMTTAASIQPIASVRPVAALAYIYFDFAASTNDPLVKLAIMQSGIEIAAATLQSSATNGLRNAWGSVTIVGNAPTSSSPYLEITMTPGIAVTWVVNLGAAMLEAASSAGVFFSGSHPASMWKGGNDYLANAPNLVATYVFRIKDLHRRDPVNWPYDRIELGATASLRESSAFDLRLTPRIVELLEDDRDRLAVDAVFSTIPETFSARFAGAL